MAKKKSNPRKETPDAESASVPSQEGNGGKVSGKKLAELAELMLQLAGSASMPRDGAHVLLHEAYESSDRAERVRLARQALELSPNCADAYVLLAEEAESRKEALQHYEKAVAVAEQALGPKVFEQGVGNFWGVVETRPYMRARECLAHFLWTMGRRDNAIAHLQDMLRLNPNDDQRVRYTLSGWLINEGRDADLSRLLAQTDDSSAGWIYTKALATFRLEGDTEKAGKLLKAARKANKFVPDFLLDRKLLPQQPPSLQAIGTEDEAILYAANALSGWKGTPGATDWLKQSEPRKKKKTPREKPLGPSPVLKKRLGELQQVFDVWQVDFRHFGSRIEEGGELFNPWLVLIGSVNSGLILSQKMSLEYPTAKLVWDVLAKAMKLAHRPTEIEVRPGEIWDELEPHLDDLGVPVTHADELEMLDYLFTDLKESMGQDGPPGLLEMPGVDRERVAAFHEAAAEFYRRAPWSKLGYEAAIRIATDRFESGPWYAVIMGQSGLTFGLALYDDLELLKKLWGGEMDDEENARETVALTMTFGEAAESTDADLDAIEEFDFEIAGPRAYPLIFRKERGLSMRPPLAWELELMEACLRAIPDFVIKHSPDDLSTHKIAVPVVTGPLELTVAWLDD